ncbi:MAG: hypothetical protein ACRD8W_22785, partial [Nitrososphaeraceae archaeon]
ILPAFISYLSGTTINEVQSSTANLRNWYPSPLQNSKPHWNMAVMKCPPSQFGTLILLQVIIVPYSYRTLISP